jgi:hypothetical protein
MKIKIRITEKPVIFVDLENKSTLYKNLQDDDRKKKNVAIYETVQIFDEIDQLLLISSNRISL